MKPKRKHYDPQLGLALREKGVAQSDQAAIDEWRAEVDDVIRRVARDKAFLTTDDIWSELTTETGEGRAMGARMRAAATAGVLQPTRRYEPSNRAASHRRPVRVWKSLFYWQRMSAERRRG